MAETFYDHGIEVPRGSHGEIRAKCPECTPHRKKKNLKDLAVNTEKKTWLCHHCGWSGGLKDEPQKLYIVPKTQPKTDLPEKVINWFAGRGISQATLKRNKIGYGAVWMPQADGEVNAIQFPYYSGDVLVNIKHRDGQKNFRMEKGAERILYGINDLNEFCSIIVEGEMDKLSLEEAGYQQCLSVPDGAPSANTKNYASKFGFLESAEDKLQEVQEFIIAADNDEPGKRLRDELVRRLGAERCKIARWPEGCKDANDVLVKHGKERLAQCIKEAEPVPVEGIFQVSDIRQAVLDYYEHGFDRGESTGWRLVDKFYRVRPGEWTVVTGIPSHGKSEWLDALMVNLANDLGWRFGICSMENLPIERHFVKLSEKLTCLPFHDRMECQRMDKDILSKTLDWAADHFFFLQPNDEDLTVDGILKLAKVLVYRHGINGLIVDPWNELDHSWADRETETRYISSALTKIRRFARNHRVHVWVVAHPTKLAKDKKGGYPVPTPYDISGSSHWRNKADNAVAVYRENVADPKERAVQIHVQKVRFKEVGRPGLATLYYDYISGRYSE